MYLKLGRLYLGLEKTTQGVKALQKVCVYKILAKLAQQSLIVIDGCFEIKLFYGPLYVLVDIFFCF